MQRNQVELNKLKKELKQITLQRNNLRKWLYISLINDGSYKVKKNWFYRIPDHVEDWMEIKEDSEYAYLILKDADEERKTRGEVGTYSYESS